jgi:putative FmdB family regulatory protein
VPVYEYVCPLCNRELEVVQKINDPAPYCSNCIESLYEDSTDLQQIKMEKKISKTSFALKGSGWAKDKYGK